MARVNINGFVATEEELKKITAGTELNDDYGTGVEWSWTDTAGSKFRATLVPDSGKYWIRCDWDAGIPAELVAELRSRLGQKSTEAQRKAGAKYDKANTKSYAFKLNKETDKDIIAVLDRSPNKQALFKMAMREFILEQKGKRF